MISDPLQEHLLGRRGAVFVSGIMTVISTIGAAFTRSAFQLFGCRVVTGVALGAKASVGESAIGE
jgi:MFS family permease